MYLTLLKGKIHRATVTSTDIGYEGSITIDPVLLEAADILPYEQVDVLNISNGARFTTYAILGKKRGNGQMTINGAAARLVQPNDLVIVCAYGRMEAKDAKKYKPKVVSVDSKNRIAHNGRSAA
jgi:L-aspartate-alpha-decarboxylase